jgi:hypothetical protein
MKNESNLYKIEGVISINTELDSQASVLSKVRALPGVTTVGFHPKEKEGEDYSAVIDNKDYKGELVIKFDDFPFKDFDRKTKLKELVNIIRKIRAVNFFRVNLSVILEHGAL